MNTQIKEQLDNLVGKTINFQNKNIVIKKFKEVAGNICVVTDARTFQYYPKEIQSEFLDLISDVKIQEEFTLPPMKKNESIVPAVPEENTTIKNALLDALKTVKENPSFIAQAKSICDITNTLINVQKVEIEMLKMQKDLS